MSKMSESVGVSKGVFVAGLIATLLLSVILSYGVLVVTSSQEGEKGDTGVAGPQGIRGETGLQGIEGEEGEKGEKGIPGGVEPYVSALLTSSYTDIWLGTDYHNVEGLMINFGSDPAYDVTITITWHTSSGEFTGDPHFLGTFNGYEIYEYSKRYDIEGNFDYITWEITWS